MKYHQLNGGKEQRCQTEIIASAAVVSKIQTPPQQVLGKGYVEKLNGGEKYQSESREVRGDLWTLLKCLCSGGRISCYMMKSLQSLWSPALLVCVRAR